MTISVLGLPKQITEKIKQLKQDEFSIIELSSLEKVRLSEHEIIFVSLAQAKKYKMQLHSAHTIVLVYLSKTDSISSPFQIAKDIDAFSLISDEDLKNIETTFRLAHEEVIKKKKNAFIKGKTIGVISTKGGVGKTFISYELAHHLNSYVYSDLLLIDTGVPFGSSKSILNLNSTTSWKVLRPLLKNGKDLTQSRFKAQVVKIPYQFDVLPAPHSIQEDPLSSTELSHLTQIAKENYALTVVDLSSVNGHELQEHLAIFDLIVWIFTPDASSIIHTLEFQKSASEKTILYVSNMVEPSLDASLLSAVEQKLKPAKFIVIENDQEAVRYHQRSFKLFTDETLLLTQQLKNLAREVFLKLS